MKKSFKWLALVSLLLIVVMSFALVSCGGGGDDTDTNTDTNTDTDTDTEQVPSSYTITFKQADGTEEKVTVKAGETVTVPTVIQKDGYSVAWETTDFSNISGDMTVNAVKTPIEYTITYELDGGNNSADNPTKYTIETSTIALATPSKTGNKFLGWYSDAELTTAVTEIALGSKGNVTLYAGWELVQYEITYETGAGTNDIGNPVKYTLSENDLVLKPAVAPEGYDFEGWYLEAGYQTKVETIEAGTTGKITLYARYEFEKFDINYELNGGKLKGDYAEKFNKTESVVLPTPTKNGYDFKGWFTDIDCTDGNIITSIAKGTEENVTVYAKWTTTQYTLEYVVGEFASVNPENPTTYTIETVFDLLDPVDVKAGYKFAGWFINGAYTQEIESLNKTVDISKLYAKFDAITYDITYELVGGKNADTNPTTYTLENVGEDALVLADPTFAGANFLGWYVGENKVTEVPATVGGVTLTAKWEYVTYNIEYVLNQVGATNASTNVATYSRDKDFDLAAPIKENVNFIGWYLEPEFTTKVEKTNSLVGNVTLYAKWSKTINLTSSDLSLDIQNGVQNGDVKGALLDGKTECAGIWDWSSGQEWYNKNSNKTTVNETEVDVVDSITITLNNATSLAGIKFYAKGNWINFTVKALNSKGEEVLTWTENLNITDSTGEFVVLSSESDKVCEDVKTITITCNSSGKIYRIAEIVVEVPNPAYEAPAVEETPAE